jgi:hypothetical protein
VPEVESAPQFLLQSYPQALSTDRARLWKTGQTTERTPPHLTFALGVVYTPQQKIFAKVKAAIWPLTCAFITVMKVTSVKREID